MSTAVSSAHQNKKQSIIPIQRKIRGRTASCVVRLQDKQSNDTTTFSSTSSGGQAIDKFIIAMKNYFTLPKLLAKLQDIGIGIVGTALFRMNWLPKELKNVAQANADFNDFF
eukprot:3296087-Ditylum_brightwellii.AAC.1